MGRFLGLIVMILCIMGVLFYPVPAKADGLESNLDKPAVELGLEELEVFLAQLDQELSQSLPELNLMELFQNLKEGKVDFSINNLLQSLLHYFFRELVSNSSLLGKLIVLAIMASILHSLQAAFEEGTISKLANAIIFLVLISLALTSFQQVITAGQGAIEQMVIFIYAMLPIMLTLIASVGGFTTAAIIHPLVISALSIISSLTVNLVFPLIYLSGILTIVNHISEQFQVTRLAKLMKEISLGLLGLFLTIFVGILSIQGVAGAVADGVALRTAKFLTGSFVPVVGRVFSDALEAVVGTSLLLKNAVSLIGVLVIISICLIPSLKIISIALIYRLAAAIIQPFGAGATAQMLESLAGVLILVFGAVATVGLMFFMVVTVIAGLGNFTVLLR